MHEYRIARLAEKKKRKRSLKKIFLYSFISFLFIIFVTMGYSWMTYSKTAGHILDGTIINNIDCSGMTFAEAEQALASQNKNKKIKIYSSGEYKDYVNVDMLKLDYGKSIYNVGKISINNFLKYHVLGMKRNIKLGAKVISGKHELLLQLKKMKVFENTVLEKIPTRNAYIKLKRPDFPIEKEVYGNELDHKRIRDKILENISEGNWVLYYDQRNFYKLPDIMSDDKNLKKMQNFYKKNIGQKITYKLGNKNVIIREASLKKMICSDKNLRPYINRRAVRTFVKNFTDKYDTLGAVRKFRSPAGEKVTVSGGNYGYKISAKSEYKWLLRTLKKRRDAVRVPKYLQKAAKATIDEDLGDIFVEIDLSKQRLWLIEKGKVAISSPVVTGNILQNYVTPTGTYAITYKTRNATLRGRERNGTRYESPVSYWMPFAGDIGMHDAPWRGSFGGNIYLGSGSHGCVNLPISSAANIYNKVYTGCAVVVHK